MSKEHTPDAARDPKPRKVAYYIIGPELYERLVRYLGMQPYIHAGTLIERLEREATAVLTEVKEAPERINGWPVDADGWPVLVTGERLEVGHYDPCTDEYLQSDGSWLSAMNGGDLAANVEKSAEEVDNHGRN